MKLLKIIWKNIKLLLRSKTSALVLIFAPLLIILLVGVSFSASSSYFLKIGVFSEEYTALTESFIENIDQESYSIIKYDDQESCVNDIKYGLIHTCIVFPPGLKVDNELQSEITFYVDESKINLVYLVINSLTHSVSKTTSEISVDLTTNIVNTMFDTDRKISTALEKLAKIASNNDEIYLAEDFSYDKIKNLDLEIPEKADVGIISSPIQIIIDALNYTKSKALTVSREGLLFLEDLENDHPEVNISEYDSYKDKFLDINTTVRRKYDEVIDDIDSMDRVIQDIDENIEQLTTKLTFSKIAQRDVVPKLEFMKMQTEEIKLIIGDINSILKDARNNIAAIEITAPENIVAPIKNRIEPVVKEKSALNYMFPTLIILLVMFVGILLPTLLIIIDKNSKAFFRVFNSPTKDYVFIVSNYLTSILLVFFQLLIILAVTEYFFPINIFASPAILFVSLFATSSVFIFIGMLIGYIFNSEEIATIASLSVGSAFLFTSGVIFPLESIPSYILDKLKFNPFLLGTDIFKKILLFNVGFDEVRSSLLILIGYSVIFIILIILVQRISKIKFLTNIPTKKQMQKEIIFEYFQMEDVPITALPQFIVHIKAMSETEFEKVLHDKAIRLWAKKVLKSPKLCRALDKIVPKTKEKIIEVLMEENNRRKKLMEKINS
ncbi:MAG: ABC transporter permease [Nanoarchaeota archaeon]|nr:ABC transporter permease [Nanoarchaeota archaeon]